MFHNSVKLFLKSIVPLLMIIIFFSQPLRGKDLMIDDFQSAGNERWEFISDQVMGGVSTGKLLFKNQNEDGYLHLTGNVSPKNQGGFIQARTSLKNVLTNDIKGTIENINKGLVAYKNDKAGTIHAALGKLSFDENQLAENTVSFIDEIKKIKPSGLKGNFINSVFVSSSMGFGLRLEI